MRLWGVRVSKGPIVPLDSTIAGVNWVTSHAAEIEVANMSLGFPGYQVALDEAIAEYC